MNYGILKIEGQNYVPLEHAAFRAHVPAPFLKKIARSGELAFREIKDHFLVSEDSLNSYIAAREPVRTVPVKAIETQWESEDQRNISQYRDISAPVSATIYEEPAPSASVNEDVSIVVPALSELVPNTTGIVLAQGAVPTGQTVTVEEAAVRAGLSENYIGKLVRGGEISATTEKDGMRISQDSLNDFIARRAKRLEERRARLAQERALVYSNADMHADSPVHFIEAPTPVTRRTEFARQAGVLAIALVIGTGLFTLAHMTPRSEFSSKARNMMAAASQSVGDYLPTSFNDFARTFNTDVNSLFASLFGRSENTVLVVNSAQTSPAPIAVQPTAVPAAVPVAPMPAAPAPVINQTIIQQPVIERVVQTQSVFSGVSQQSLEEQLQQLDNKLSGRMYSLTSANTTSIAQNYNVTAQTNAINLLTNTRIDTPTISGGTISGTNISAGNLTASGSVQFGDIVFTNATTTNFAATGVTTLANTTINGDLSLTGTLSFSGSSSTINANGGIFSYATSTNAYFASLTAGSATTTGDLTVGGNLLVNGNSFTIGTSTSNLLVINSSINSNLIPNGNKIYDIGSPSYFWRNGYIDTLNVNNLSAASSSLGGTASETFTLNSDNATLDAEDMNLVFYRGTVVPNAVISWNSINKRFEFNQAAFFQNQSGSTTQATLSLKGVSGQTGNLFSIASSSGSTVFAVGSDGSVTISTSTIVSLTSGTSTMTNLSVTGLATSTFAGPLSVSGNFNFNGAILQNGVPFSSSQWVTNGSNISFTGGKVGIGTAGPNNALTVVGTTSVGISYANTSGHALISVDGGDAFQTGYYIYKNGIEKSQIAVLANSNDLSFSMAGTERLRIAAGGNIGIGNAAPSYLLDVSGTGHFTGTVDADRFVATSSSATTLLNGNLTVNGGSSFANATSTNLFSTTASSTNLFSTSATIGTLRLTGGFVSQASSTVTGAFTVTGATALGSTLNVTGNTTLANATTTNLFSTTASSTNLFSQLAGVGTLTLGNKLTVANGGTGVGTLTGVAIGNGTSAFTAGSAQTCTNQFVRAMSASYVATCATVSLTADVTGTLGVANGGTGITSFGTGIATFLGTPSSANLIAALTDETGTGSAVFAASPTLTGTVTAAAANFSGSVGVGTTTPRTRLSIQNVGDNSQIGAGTAGLSLYNTAGLGYTQIFSGSDNNTYFVNGNAAKIFFTDSSASAKLTVDTSSGNVGIGTTTPFRKFAVVNTASVAQASVAYDTTRVAELYTDSSGEFHINPSGGDLYQDDSNHWICSGGSCPAGAPSGTGNLIVENYVGIGTSTPSQQLSVQGLLQVGANSNAPVTMGTATSTFNGDVKILGKLDVATIDPVYMVDEVKYATYGHSTIGIHEETVSKITPSQWDPVKKMYAYTIDFDTLEKGSDLWLFRQVTDFGPTWQNLVVTLTPGFDGRTYYEQDPSHNELHIYASKSGPVSLRLIANRYDFSKWPNLRPDQDGDDAGAHVVSEKAPLMNVKNATTETTAAHGNVSN